MENKMSVYELAREMAYFYMASDARGHVEIGFDSHGKPTFHCQGSARPPVVTVIKPKGEVLGMWGVDDPFNEKEVIAAFQGKIQSIIDMKRVDHTPNY